MDEARAARLYREAKAALWDTLDEQYQNRVAMAGRYNGGDTQMAAGQPLTDADRAP